MHARSRAPTFRDTSRAVVSSPTGLDLIVSPVCSVGARASKKASRAATTRARGLARRQLLIRQVARLPRRELLANEIRRSNGAQNDAQAGESL